MIKDMDLDKTSPKVHREVQPSLGRLEECNDIAIEQYQGYAY